MNENGLQDVWMDSSYSPLLEVFFYRLIKERKKEREREREREGERKREEWVPIFCNNKKVAFYLSFIFCMDMMMMMMMASGTFFDTVKLTFISSQNVQVQGTGNNLTISKKWPLILFFSLSLSLSLSLKQISSNFQLKTLYCSSSSFSSSLFINFLFAKARILKIYNIIFPDFIRFSIRF